MQRFTFAVACREFGAIAARTSVACSWKNLIVRQSRLMDLQVVSPGPLTKQALFNFKQHNSFPTGQKYRHFSTGSDKNAKSSNHPGITVVGTPDPVTWIRNTVVLFLIKIYFDFNISALEFDNGVKQALVHVSTLISLGKFEELRGMVSSEAVEHVKRKCQALNEDQRQSLAIALDDIIFLIPEDVSVFFDNKGRKFCYILVRFWHLSNADVPDDPESDRIFKMTTKLGDGPPKKIITALYEFQKNLTEDAEFEWTVTSIWHWKRLE